MITNNSECVTKDWYALTIDGNYSNQVTLKLDKERGGYLLSSSSGLNTLTLTANNSDNAVSRTITTEANQIFIYETDEGTIGIASIGDVNSDSVITVDDATILQQFLAEYAELDLNDKKIFLQADMNGDGYVNVKDVTAIQRRLVELE